MRVNRGVQKMVAAQRLTVLIPTPGALVGKGIVITDRPAQHPPAAAGRDLAELFYVDMHQFAAPRGLDPSDHPAGGPIQHRSLATP